MQKSRDNKKDLATKISYHFGGKIGVKNMFCDAIRMLSSWESAKDMPDLVLKSISDLMDLEGCIADAMGGDRE